MGSPCVLLNSLALFFVPGQEGVATNEVGECRLSQQKEGQCVPPRGGGMCRENHSYIWWRHTDTYFPVFLLLTWSFRISLAAQWLRLYASAAEGAGLIPKGTKIPHVSQGHQKNKTNKKKWSF